MKKPKRAYSQQDRLALAQDLEKIRQTRVRIVQKGAQAGEQDSSEETLPLLQALPQLLQALQSQREQR